MVEGIEGIKGDEKNKIKFRRKIVICLLSSILRYRTSFFTLAKFSTAKIHSVTLSAQLNNLKLIMITHVDQVAPLHMRVSVVTLETCLAVHTEAEEVHIL